MNTLKKLNEDIETLIIETSLNTAHIKSLTLAFKELASHVLTEDEATSLFDGYHHTLYENSVEQINHLSQSVSLHRILNELSDLKLFLNLHLSKNQ